jgi:hypothetical protein
MVKKMSSKMYVAQKNYYERNKEKIRAKAKAKWALEHPKKPKKTKEEKEATQRKYRKAIKEKMKEYNRIYREKNREKLNALARAKYREANPKIKKNQFGFDLSTKEGKRAYSKAYYKKNYVKPLIRNLFGIDTSTTEGKLAYRKAYKANCVDPQKERERSKKWRYGEGREAYLKSKKNYQKNNKDACNEYQRKIYARNVFKGLDVPKDLIEAKYLQLMIEREVRSEKRI